MNSTATQADQEAVTDILSGFRRSVRAEMRKRGISQLQLAESLDLTQGRISQLLGDGNHNANVSTLHRVAAALDLDIEIIATLGKPKEL